ncbi:MAG: hypothetical protein ACT6S0_14195 [Roseateles sp.]|uniref:hypothetical protein n=1 Tax=Roseateles sp. TaxID=1971397 RepID=UPI00403727F0
MDDLDIRLMGRSWTTDEMSRHDELPGRLEMWNGKLCLDEAQRLVLLGALLEHVGTACAVRLGPFEAWVDAVEQRQEDLAWDRMPAVGVEQFWRPATQRLSFRQRLELKADMKLQAKCLRRHARRKATWP